MDEASQVERPPGRALRLTGLPRGADAEPGGGAAFVAYCAGGEPRAEARRKAILRAAASHRQTVRRADDSYPTALILCQRLSVALEDLARLVRALASLGENDPFHILRDARLDDLDDVFERLADDPRSFRSAVRLPTLEATDDLPAAQRDALLAASDALARRWHEQWRRCGAGWLLLRHVAYPRRSASHSSSMPRVKRMCLPILRQGSWPVRTAS
jgi:hypothetical protein